MKYYLKNSTESDKDFVYNVKKASVYNYVERIWGWNEEYQISDFESEFIIENIKIVMIDNKYVGFVQINEDVFNVNITEIHIISDFQGKGIGSDIIKNIIRQAINNNKAITIGCFINNTRARHLYERLGFKVTIITDTHCEMKYSME